MKFKQMMAWQKYLAVISEDGRLFFIEQGVPGSGVPMTAPKFTLHGIDFQAPPQSPMPGGQRLI